MSIRALPSVLAFLAIAGGLALAGAGLSGLRSGEAMPHNRNPFALQGSAYGKLLARLSETTIDRVWHLGVEQIVPHYMSGDAGHGEEGQEGFPDLAADTTVDTTAATKQRAADGSILARGKNWFNERVVAQHTRTNPNSLNQSHLATVHRDIERMLLRSFRLDPTHYGAYDSYHLFLTTYDFGGNPHMRDRAEEIAKIAIAHVFKEKEDPEPWLTAAAAAMNLYLLDATPYLESGEPMPVDLLKRHRDQIGFCLARFEEIQAAAERAGVWENLSFERQMEIAERALFAKRTFKQFDVMIARAEGVRDARDNPLPSGAGIVRKAEEAASAVPADRP